MTFKAAQAAILAELAALGWAVKADLKIPHATSPSGRTRFWFKPQAVWFTRTADAGNPCHVHYFGNARSLHAADIRTVSAAAFLADATRYACGSEPV